MNLGFHKPFDRKLYEANDDRAKKRLIEILERQGHVIIQTSETMKCDLVSRYYGNVYYHEVEVNNSWNNDWSNNFKFVRCFGRKWRLTKLYPHGLRIWQFNKDLSQVWKYSGNELKPDYLRDVYGRKMYSDERMFYIPIDKCKLYDTETDRRLKYYKERKEYIFVYDSD